MSISVTETTYPPFPRKSDLQALKERNDAWKHNTVLTLRDEKNMSWSEISDQTHYCVREARRLYFRAKKIESENPDLLLAKKFADAPTMTKEKAKYFEVRAVNILNHAILDMRDRQGLIFKEISDLTGFSISGVMAIYARASNERRVAMERLSRAAHAMESNKSEDEMASLPEKNIHPPLMQKSDAWLIKAGVNAQKYRTVLELRDGQKLAWPKIAEQMHYSYNQVRRYYNRAKKLAALSSDNPGMPLPESGVTRSVIKQEDVRFSRAQIRHELYRTVLHLRDEHGLIFTDIAKRMGFSKSRVQVLYREASRLKRMVAERSGETSQSHRKETEQKNVR